MWKLVDKLYRILFRHPVVVGIVLLSCAIFFMFMPTICYFQERATVAKIQADFRTLRGQFNSASMGEFTTVSIPIDPYSDGTPYILLLTSGTLLATSAGPDKQYGDDLVQYDPTNGYVSYGDVLTTIATGLKYDVLTTIATGLKYQGLL